MRATRWARFGIGLAAAYAVGLGCSDSHEIIRGDGPGKGGKGSGATGTGGARGGSKGGGGTRGGTAGSSGTEGGEGGDGGFAGDFDTGGTGPAAGMGGRGGFAGSGAMGGSGGSGVPPNCGDGHLDSGEICDDHNKVDGDGCSSICTEACEQCEAMHCDDSNPDGDNYTELCFNGPGETTGGPAPGVSKALLCTQLVACVRRTNCAHDAFLDCYCGTADGTGCIGGMANGLCKSEIELAVESNDPAQVNFFIAATDNASGRAFQLVDYCDRMYCETQCFGGSTGGMGGMSGAGGGGKAGGGSAGKSGSGGGGAGGAGGGKAGASGSGGTGGAGGASGGKAGAGGAGGMSGGGSGGFVDPSPMDCIGCELGDNDYMDETCAPLVGGCNTILGMAPSGTSRSELCWEALSCARRTNCASTSLGAIGCYCGTVDAIACLGTMANGQCKAEWERAFETTIAIEISSRSTDTTYAGGMVSQRLNCDSVLCADECF